MERIFKMNPAFDKRNPDPKKNYGIHGVELLMVLKGKLGAVQFLLYTNWQLPHVSEGQRNKLKPDNYFLFEPLPADLGYHSPKPMYDDHNLASKECEYLDEGPCYYDGSGLNAQEIYNTLLHEGSDGVWVKLENYYKDTFGELK